MKVKCLKLVDPDADLTVGRVYRATKTPQGFELFDDVGDELDCRRVNCRHAEWEVVADD